MTYLIAKRVLMGTALTLSLAFTATAGANDPPQKTTNKSVQSIKQIDVKTAHSLKASNLESNLGDEIEQKNGKWACRFKGGNYETHSSGSYKCTISAKANFIELEQIELDKDPRGRKRRISKCNDAGGTYYEWAGGTFACVTQARQARGRKFRKACFEAGGVLLNGSFCTKSLSSFKEQANLK